MPGPVRLLALATAAAVGTTTVLAGGSPFASATTATGTATTSIAAAPTGRLPAATDSAGPFELTGRDEVTVRRRGRLVWVRTGLKALTGPDGLEIRSTRSADYESPIATTWTSGERSGTFPVGTQDSFRGLPDFLRTTYVSRRTGEVVRRTRTDTCLAGRGQRRTPEAAPRSPYPFYCPWNPYTLGSVQGLQGGWSTAIEGWSYQPVRLPVGRYRMRIEVAPFYARELGLDAGASSHTLRLTVVDPPRRSGASRTAEGLTPRSVAPRGPGAATAAPTPAPRPGAARAGVAAAAPGPRPDLRSLPAWDIGLSGNGRLLRFAATVWNAGDSPLVIDGFREPGEDHMAAYQYFFDTDGEQVGYQQLDSAFHWHAANHRHWHYEDFAAYRLLDADQQPVRTSGKISFCLANTDAVDYTVPGADWQPEGTDLRTACGRPGSLSIREVLSAGSGDTYAQYRSGQAIRVSDLPNGRYYLAVQANPYQRLTESDTTNNDALRAIRLRGSGERRRVQVSQVGVIEEEQGGWWLQPRQIL